MFNFPIGTLGPQISTLKKKTPNCGQHLLTKVTKVGKKRYLKQSHFCFGKEFLKKMGSAKMAKSGNVPNVEIERSLRVFDILS